MDNISASGEPPKPTSERASSHNQNSSSIGDLINNQSERIKIVNVNFDGVRKTNKTILTRIISDLYTAETTEQLVDRLFDIKDKLDALKAIKKVEINVEPGPNENDYEVTFAVTESTRLIASGQTSVDNHGRSHVGVGVESPNLTGICDTVSLDAKFDGRFYFGECKYSVPLMPWKLLWAPVYSIAVSKYKHGTQPTGINQNEKAIINAINFYSKPQLEHTVQFENAWRHIKSSSRETPMDIREQCGHSLKSSIKHTATWDDRDTHTFPNEGTLARLSNEFTTNLVTGGAKFTKHELNLQYNLSLLPRYGILCQANVLAGAILGASRINICDKFFAGGPMTLRGLKQQGLEPNTKGYPTGASSYMCAGLHLYSSLPFTSPNNLINNVIRPHLFFNTGTQGELPLMSRLARREDYRNEALTFRDSLRYSCGFGLVMYLSKIRLELNYCIPLKVGQKDLTNEGFQWGFGITYT